MKDFIKQLEELLAFMCNKYITDDVFRQYGEFPWPLMDESGMDFGDGGAQIAAMDLLREYGFIEVVGAGRGRKISLTSKVRPSIKGMEFVRDKRKSILAKEWPKIVSAVTEGIVKGLKG